VSDAERAAFRNPRASAEAVDMPDWIHQMLVARMGEAGAEETCEALRSRAPVWVRVALRRGSRESAVALLAAEGIAARPHPEVKTALEVSENARKIQSSSAYLSGVVELQDAASQAAMLALRSPAAGARALDYCAGGGGKSLALADLGYAVDAHDIAPERMKDIPLRAARAGERIVIRNDRQSIDKKYDLVLVDAPCSGSGTWRRTPEAKWALTPERLRDLCDIQRNLLAEAADYVMPGGHLAYATCSVLDVENKDQVAAFLGLDTRFESVFSLALMPGQRGDGFYLHLLGSR
jgi:16S rRNA (cytosine967-C5)-methyltransferase